MGTRSTLAETVQEMQDITAAWDALLPQEDAAAPGGRP
jgi:hypothetical protein